MDKQKLIYAIPFASIAIGFATTLIGFLTMNGVIPFSVVNEVEAVLCFFAALLHKSKKVDMTPTPDAATPQQAPPPLWGTQVA